MPTEVMRALHMNEAFDVISIFADLEEFTDLRYVFFSLMFILFAFVQRLVTLLNESLRFVKKWKRHHRPFTFFCNRFQSLFPRYE